MKHGISFDVECYEQIHRQLFYGEQRSPSLDTWRATQQLLDTLAEEQTKATFFVVGNIARRFPDLVRRMFCEGHELGSHGDEHHDLRMQSAQTFRNELVRSRNTLEDLIGARVSAYRAPFFSLTTRSQRALDVLRDLEFEYDSSIFPFRGNRYGDPHARTDIHRLTNGLWEVPPSVVECAGLRMPVLGGGYVRHFPWRVQRWAMRRRQASALPAVAYFHPWEFSRSAINPSLRDFLMAPRASLRMFIFNLSRHPGRGPAMQRKLLQLLRGYRFFPLRELVQAASQRSLGKLPGDATLPEPLLPREPATLMVRQ